MLDKFDCKSCESLIPDITCFKQFIILYKVA